MAVLGAPLDPVTVSSLKGTLDYYVWRGLPVVRSWPKKPKMPRTAAVTAAYIDFGLTSKALSSLPIELQNAAVQLVALEDWTWKDVWTAALFGNLYADAPTPVPEVDTTAMPLIAGLYYSAPATAGALTTLSTPTGTIHAIPIYIPELTDIDRLGIDISATTTGTVRFAIYGPIVTTPQTAPLLIDTGTLTPSGTGLITYNAGISLLPGWYLLAYQSSLTRTVRAIAATNQIAVWGSTTGLNVGQSAYLTLAQAYGPFPSTLGASVAFSTNAARPQIVIRPM